MNLYSLNYSELTELVTKIEYGYVDKSGGKHNSIFTNPINDYLLQYPQQLIKSNLGLCFDIVEMYRDYLNKKRYYNESYYIEYHDGDILETHAFIIHKRRNNLWYECIDNSWENEIASKGYYDKEILLKSIYEWFQNFVEETYKDVDKAKFYLNRYSYPKLVFTNKLSLRDFCANRNYMDSFRVEFSGMAIVFCKTKVLVLETKHNEFVFPKGHIEAGEDSKDASIRECLEESGVSLVNAKYYGECGEYSYTFSAGHLKIPNDDFYRTFEVNKITKTIYVHVYEIDDYQDFTLESIFIHGLWIEISDISKTITHENTRELFNKALQLFKANNV